MEVSRERRIFNLLHMQLVSFAAGVRLFEGLGGGLT